MVLFVGVGSVLGLASVALIYPVDLSPWRLIADLWRFGGGSWAAH